MTDQTVNAIDRVPDDKIDETAGCENYQGRNIEWEIMSFFSRLLSLVLVGIVCWFRLIAFWHGHSGHRELCNTLLCT